MEIIENSKDLNFFVDIETQFLENLIEKNRPAGAPLDRRLNVYLNLICKDIVNRNLDFQDIITGMEAKVKYFKDKLVIQTVDKVDSNTENKLLTKRGKN